MDGISDETLTQLDQWARGFADGETVNTEFSELGASVQLTFSRKMGRGQTEETDLTGQAAVGMTEMALPPEVEPMQLGDNVVIKLPPTQTVMLYQLTHTVRRRSRIVASYSSYVLVIPTQRTARQMHGPAQRQAQVLMGEFGLSAEQAQAVLLAVAPELAVESARLAVAAYNTVNGDPRGTLGILTRLADTERAQRRKLRHATHYEPDPSLTPDQIKQLLRGAVAFARAKWPC